MSPLTAAHALPQAAFSVVAPETPATREIDALTLLRLAHDRARAELQLETARQLGGDREARIALMIPEALWGESLRAFLLGELRLSPYADWNTIWVTTSPEAIEAGALPTSPALKERAETTARRGIASIEAGYRAGEADAEACADAVKALAAEVRANWERACGQR